MTFQIAAMLLGLLAVCAVSIYGIRGLKINLGNAARGYRELRELYETGSHIASAKTLLSRSDYAGARLELDRATTRLQIDSQRGQNEPLLLDTESGKRSQNNLRDTLRQANRLLQIPPGDSALGSSPENIMQLLNQSFGIVASIALEIRSSIAAEEVAAQSHWQRTITWAIAASCIGFGIVVVLGVLQYRSVMSPMHSLRAVANRMAAGEFDQRVHQTAMLNLRSLETILITWPSSCKISIAIWSRRSIPNHGN